MRKWDTRVRHQGHRQDPVRDPSTVSDVFRAAVCWLLLGLGLALILMPHAPLWAAPAQARAIAVVPLDSLSKYTSHAWMRSAFAEVLASRMIGASGIRVIDGGVLAKALRGTEPQLPEAISLEQALQAGKSVEADVIIRGTVDKRVNQILFQLTLHRVSDGKPLGDVSLAGDFEAPWDSLNLLVRQTLQKLNAPPSKGQEERLATQAARDRYSLTLFGRGVNQLYGLSGPVDLLGSEENLRRALRIDPPNALFSYFFGLNRLEQGDDSDANAAWFEALKTWPDFPPVRRQMARLSEIDNHLDDAISYLQVVLGIEPSDMQAHFDLGRLLVEVGKPGPALDEVTLVASSSASLRLKIPALKLQAQLRATLDDVNGMGESYKALLALAPDDLEARTGLAAWYYRKNALADAEAQFKALASRDPGNPMPIHLLGEVRLMRGNHEGAAEAFKAEGAIRPSHPTAWSYLGETYRRLHALPKEIDSEGMAQVRDKKNPIPLNNLAIARFKEGDMHSAQILLKQAIELAPGWGLLHQNLGIVLVRLHLEDKAIESLELATQLSPKLGTAWYQLGILQARGGELKQASASFKAATDAEPGMAGAWFNAGSVYEALGDKRAAAKAFQTYLELSPKATDAEAVRGRIAQLK